MQDMSYRLFGISVGRTGMACGFRCEGRIPDGADGPLLEDTVS